MDLPVTLQPAPPLTDSQNAPFTVMAFHTALYLIKKHIHFAAQKVQQFAHAHRINWSYDTLLDPKAARPFEKQNGSTSWETKPCITPLQATGYAFRDKASDGGLRSPPQPEHVGPGIRKYQWGWLLSLLHLIIHLQNVCFRSWQVEL